MVTLLAISPGDDTDTVTEVDADAVASVAVVVMLTVERAVASGAAVVRMLATVGFVAPSGAATADCTTAKANPLNTSRTSDLSGVCEAELPLPVPIIDAQCRMARIHSGRQQNARLGRHKYMVTW
jgi:hypothetical protein